MAYRAVSRDLSLPPDTQPRSTRVSGGRGSSIAGPTTAEVPLHTQTHTVRVNRTVKALQNFYSTSMTHFYGTFASLPRHFSGSPCIYACHVYICYYSWTCLYFLLVCHCFSGSLPHMEHTQDLQPPRVDLVGSLNPS